MAARTGARAFRQAAIAKGKVWQIYPDRKPRHIMFEGTKTAAGRYLSANRLNRAYKKGTIRRAQVIWER
jgi:hypothetical protein